jgi:WG containing repeat
MKSKLILFLALVLSGGLTSSNAQNIPALFPIIEDGKSGFIDQTGTVIIPTNTDWLPNLPLEGKHFVEGLEPAQTRWKPGMVGGSKWGYLNAKGKFEIEPQFTLATSYSEGLAAVRDVYNRYGYKYGYISHAGKYVIMPQFEEAFGFSEGLAQVGDTNHLMGFIDRSGKWVIKPQFRSFSRHSNFSDGLACVPTNDVTLKFPFESGSNPEFKWGYINTNGEQVIGFRFKAASAFSEGLAFVEETNGFGYIDKTGVYVIPPKFDTAYNFSEGLARVRAERDMAFINIKGDIVFTVTNAEWSDGFSEGLANVSLRKAVGEQIWGYIDHTGQFVIKPQFQQAEPFYDGLAQVVIDNKSAYIDKAGHFVWKQP